MIELLPYQKTGAAFLASRERAGLFDEMGVGKTAQAIHACDLAGAKRILVICPAAVREVWRGEFRKFARIPRRITKGATLQDLNLWLRGKTDVLLVSYDMATRWAKHLDGALAEVCIFDEAHFLKSPTAARTRAMLGRGCDGRDGVARWSGRVWFLTGTPAPNDPADIWPLLRFTGATPLGLATWVNRYMRIKPSAYSTRTTPRKETVAELKQSIDSVSIRRTKTDVNLQIPPIWLTTQTIDGDTAEIRALLSQHPGLEASIMEAVEKGGLSFLDAQHIATLRRLTGEAKAPALVELISEELENGIEKIVLFGLHKSSIGIVQRGLGRFGCVRIDGSVGEQDRVQAIQDFQNGSARVFIGNIRAAGTGITLTAASEIVVFEPDWSPANNAQALMRVHRLGQTQTVRARFVALANSIDVNVIDTLAHKTAALAAIGFDGLTAPALTA